MRDDTFLTREREIEDSFIFPFRFLFYFTLKKTMELTFQLLEQGFSTNKQKKLLQQERGYFYFMEERAFFLFSFVSTIVGAWGFKH